jgi:hypothetical protein
MQIYCLVLLATVAYAIDTVDVESKGVISQKAPSSFQNCNCQCSHYTWRDSYGKKQGNCRSSDNTGAQWCYTNSNSCTDLKYSKNRRDSYGSVRRWSYQACSTPSRRSNKCSNYGNGGGFGQGGGQGNGGHNGGHGNGGHGNGFGNGNNHNNNNGFNGNNHNNNNGFNGNNHNNNNNGFNNNNGHNNNGFNNNNGHNNGGGFGFNGNNGGNQYGSNGGNQYGSNGGNQFGNSRPGNVLGGILGSILGGNRPRTAASVGGKIVGDLLSGSTSGISFSQ